MARARTSAPAPAARRRRLRRALLVALGSLALVGAALAAVVAVRGPFFFVGCDPDSMLARELGRTSLVRGADGSVLATIAAEHENRPVALEEMAPSLRDAVVAVEDRRFFRHRGIDYRGTLRAFLANREAGETVQGGSTITQQLARNLYLGSERTLGRKLTEGCVAVELDRDWSKQRILAAYLNRVYFGNRAYGAEAAARTYFSKPAAKLELEEAALLAGLIQSPSALDPFERPEQARARRDVVLDAMLEVGEISEGEHARARRAELRLRPSPAFGRQREGYLATTIERELAEVYGEGAVREGGFEVYTTIDPRLQKLAREAIAATLDREDDPAAALVAVNPLTGAVRAMAAVVPGRRTLSFNLAAEGRRQAGSTFKTFVLAEAVSRGINPWATKYLSAPFDGPPQPDGKPWRVETYDGTYEGEVSLVRATLASDNSAYARLTLDLGPKAVATLAGRMGIESELEPVPALGLGAGAVSPLELASAYGTLAAAGSHATPFLIRRVVLPGGEVDDTGRWGKVERERALPQAVAYEVTRVLERNVEAGTGTGAQIGRPAAGKTGTTDDHADAWFAGYVPQLATAVWVGYPKAEVPMTDVHGISVSGGSFPATIWQRFMAPALEPMRPRGWEAPAQTVGWKRFCGRFQLAASADDARPEAGCPKPAQPVKVVKTPQQPTGPVLETAAPAPAPPPPTTAQPPPAEPAPPELVGALGVAATRIDAETGEVEVDGRRFVAATADGSRLRPGTEVEVVAVEDGIAYVMPADTSAGG